MECEPEMKIGGIIRVLFCCTAVIWFNIVAKADMTDGGVYSFQGVHYVASYKGCDRAALSNIETLSSTLLDAAKASGATVLEYSSHIFAPDGFTMVILLSESHASIHTYPEHGACFVDLFTCGTHCSYTAFERTLREYLKPESVDQNILSRH